MVAGILTAGANPEPLRQRAMAARLLLAEEACRAGDPMPLVRLQWGDDLILDEFQLDIIRSVFDPSIAEVYVKGNTGCGKGGAAAIAICLWYQVWPDARVVISRDSEQRAIKVMWNEVRKWWQKMRHPPPAELQAKGAVHPVNRQRECAVVNPKSEEGFQGVHSEHVLIVFDEATAAVLEERYKLAKTQATKFLALANPRTTSGAFRSAFDLADDPDITQTVSGPHGKRRLITIGGMDCMNVRLKRLEKPVAPSGGIDIDGRYYTAGETITPEDFEKRKPIIPGQTCYDKWIGLCQHPDPVFVAVYAHGRFPGEDPEKQLIRRAWLTDCVGAHRRYQRLRERAKGRASWLRKLVDDIFPIQAIGLDVAASLTGDETILTVGGDRGIREQVACQLPTAPDVADWVLRTCEDRWGIVLTRGGLPIAIDYDGGFGNAVGALLRRKGVRVIEIRGATPPDVNPDKYLNKRTEAWGELAARFDPDGQWKGVPFWIPDDRLLHEELLAPEKIYMRKDSILFRVTPKQKVPGVDDVTSIAEKIGRSPDRGDSAVYFFRALQVKGADLSAWLNSGAF